MYGGKEGTLILELHGPLTLNNLFGFQEQAHAMLTHITPLLKCFPTVDAAEAAL